MACLGQIPEETAHVLQNLVSANGLTSILEEQNSNVQEQQCTQQSSYYDIDKFSEVAKTRLNDFSILTTNIESLNAKFDDLLIHITELKKQ